MSAAPSPVATLALLQELTVPTLAGLAGLALWLGVVRRSLPGTPEGREGRGLLGLFVIAQLFTWTAVGFFGRGDTEVGFEEQMGALAAGNAVGVFGLLLVLRAHPRGRDAVGLVAQARGSPLLVGLAGYLLAVPLMAGLALLNAELVTALGYDADPAEPQLLVRQFLEAGAPITPMLLLSMAFVIPFAEELFFRGALYGGLRGRLGPRPAGLLSALLFALLHASPSHLLPLTGLGVLLAWTYERTGSLAAPTALHALNNLLTLAIYASLGTEALP